MHGDTPSDPARRALATLAISGAALMLSAAAAVPALASDRGQGDAHSNRASAHSAHTTADADDADETETDERTDDTDSQDDGDEAAARTASTDDDGDDGDEDSADADASVQANAAGTADDPAGNNGTVKIHDVAGDLSHHNVPHVDCDFTVAFWGFDLNQALTVSFAGQAPTGKDVPLPVSGNTITSPDAAGGGTDYDGELLFDADDLGLTALGDPHPQQGYHVKLTVDTGEPGGHKYKVFWISPCSGLTGATVLGSDTTGVTGTSVAAGSVESPTTETSDTPTVLGTRITRTAPERPGALPFTGAEIGGMLVAGLATLAAGTAMTLAGRRRRAARVSAPS